MKTTISQTKYFTVINNGNGTVSIFKYDRPSLKTTLRKFDYEKEISLGNSIEQIFCDYHKTK